MLVMLLKLFAIANAYQRAIQLGYSITLSAKPGALGLNELLALTTRSVNPQCWRRYDIVAVVAIWEIITNGKRFGHDNGNDFWLWLFSLSSLSELTFWTYDKIEQLKELWPQKRIFKRQRTKDMPDKEKQEFIQAFLATADEDDFTQQMLAWGDNIHQRMDTLQQEINVYRARYQPPLGCLRTGSTMRLSARCFMEPRIKAQLLISLWRKKANVPGKRKNYRS